MRHHDDLVHEAHAVRAKLVSRRSFLARAAAAGFSLAFADGLLQRGASAAMSRTLPSSTSIEEPRSSRIRLSTRASVFRRWRRWHGESRSFPPTCRP
jgi:hypothetical protein